MNPVHPEPNILATHLINPILSTSGDYSDVYKCTLTSGLESTLVAVKLVRFGRHKKYYGRILREINLRMKLNHQNIIQLLGTTREFQGGSFPSFVFPWMPSGDLHCYIAYHGTGIETPTKLSLVRDIASGVTYLHKSHVVHGNLESKNVLIGPENRAYLTGFSLSTDLNTSQLLGAPESGGVRFAAPECFVDEEGDNSLPIINSDIYSIGCVLFHVSVCLEIVTILKLAFRFSQGVCHGMIQNLATLSTNFDSVVCRHVQGAAVSMTFCGTSSHAAAPSHRAIDHPQHRSSNFSNINTSLVRPISLQIT